MVKPIVPLQGTTMIGIDMNRDEMLSELRLRICRVIFTKVDGEERDMHCTLQSHSLPEKYQAMSPSDPADMQPNDKVIRAWDINKGAFRSFRVENVISFT